MQTGEPGSAADADDAVSPELRVINRQQLAEVAVDLLPIRGAAGTYPAQFRLECLSHDNLFFIVSPHDIVSGKPTDIDDHVEWLLAHQKCVANSVCLSAFSLWYLLPSSHPVVVAITKIVCKLTLP